MTQRLYVRLFFLLLFLAGTATGLYAQRHMKDSISIFQLLALSNAQQVDAQYDSAFSLAYQAQKLAKKMNYTHGEAWSAIKINDLLIETDRLDEADKNVLSLQRFGHILKDSMVLAIASLHKAQVRLYREQWDSAIHFFDECLKFKLEAARTSYTALAYNDLGYTWGKKENLEKMTDYCLRSLALYEELNNPVGCAMALGNISTVYHDLRQYAKAADYAKRALAYREKAGDINRLALACCNLSQTLIRVDTADAAKYMLLCQKYALQSGDEARIVHSYTTSSVVTNGRKLFKEAFEYELKAIALLEKSGADNRMLARRYIAAAFYANTLKMDTSVALAYFNKSLKLSEASGMKRNLQDVYQYMTDFYKTNRDFKQAYNNYIKYIAYRDSATSSEREANIAELETKYQTAKKDVEIARLNADQQIKQLEIEKQRAIINGNRVEASKKEIEINLLVQQKQLQELKLAQQGEELARQKLLAKNNEQALQLVRQEKMLNENQLQQQRQLRNGIIAGSLLLLIVVAFAFSRYQLKRKLAQQAAVQQMRNNIASDLHDDIGASLSNINILNELTRRHSRDPQKVSEYLLRASEDIKQVSEGISDIVWNINPRYDNLENLFIRMKRYAADILDGKNIHYTIDLPDHTGGWSLDMNKRRDLYLFFKEVINNLAKYSRARHARIELKMEQPWVKLHIQDDGVGFDKSLVLSGNGLHNMNQRAMMLKGNLVIDSKPGHGTEVMLNIPADNA